MFSLSCKEQLIQCLLDNPALKDKAIRFEVQPMPGVLEDVDADPLSDALSRAWNTMRYLPYKPDQRLDCFEALLLHGTTGIGSWNGEGGLRLKKMLSGKEDNFDRWYRLALSANTGAVTNALVCYGELVEALRDDLEDILSPVGRQLALENPMELIRQVRDPQYIFDFERLVNCFTQYLIPMQLLYQSIGSPLILSPCELNYIGPPN